MEESLISFDHHTKTRPCQSAIDRMVQVLEEHEPNPDAHSRSIYDLAHASKEDTFVFTSSGAEAISQVIFSVFLQTARKEGKTQWI
ncbi:MAG: hypothetical protein FJZ64_04855, partial [Chlamydiae bacterium]|nr:hypothetical protein [Chlamydiota bacterium]